MRCWRRTWTSAHSPPAHKGKILCFLLHVVLFISFFFFFKFWLTVFDVATFISGHWHHSRVYLFIVHCWFKLRRTAISPDTDDRQFAPSFSKLASDSLQATLSLKCALETLGGNISPAVLFLLGHWFQWRNLTSCCETTVFIAIVCVREWLSHTKATLLMGRNLNTCFRILRSLNPFNIAEERLALLLSCKYSR